MTEKRVCASIIEDTIEGMVSVANQTPADLVELRLDYISEEPDFEKIKAITKPVIATYMPEWEGGRFKAGEKERVGLLEATLPHVQYVTIELATDEELRDALIKKAKAAGVKVIVASHDFAKTPPLPEVIEILRREQASGADIAKVAFTPKSEADVLTVVRATVEHELSIPVIPLSMGRLGRASRILGPLFGSYLTYAAASKERKAAAGQLTVGEVNSILNALQTN